MSSLADVKLPAWVIEHKVSVPIGSIGAARIERYTVTEERAEESNWEAVMNGDERAPALPGEYTGLVVDGIMVMSDTASEIQDHLDFISKAQGRVLLTGLGIGMCLQALLRKPNVERVTVVEKSADVLALVSDHYLARFGDARMTFINADAFEWQPAPGTSFDAVWHDIWPLAIGAFWPQHVRLYERYLPFARRQDSWRAQWMQGHWEKETSKVAEGNFHADPELHDNDLGDKDGG